METPVIRTEEYATVSELIDAIFALDERVAVLETPVKMGIDGDFYPATFEDATHLLRIALGEKGYPKIKHTHDIAWCECDGGGDSWVAEELSHEGWLILATDRPLEDGEWVVFIPNIVSDMKEFWTKAPNEHDMIWKSREAELLPFLKELKEPVLPPIQQE